MTIFQELCKWKDLTAKNRLLVVLKIVILGLAITDFVQNIMEVVKFLNVPLDLFFQKVGNGFYVISRSFSKSTTDRSTCFFFETSNATNASSTTTTNSTKSYSISSQDLSSIFNNNGVKWAYAAFDIAWLALGLMTMIADMLDKRFPRCGRQLSHKVNYVLLLLISLLTLPTRGLIVGYNLQENCLGDSILVGFVGPFVYAMVTIAALALFIFFVCRYVCCKDSSMKFCQDSQCQQYCQKIVGGIFGLYILFGFATIVSSWGATPLAFDIIMVILVVLEFLMAFCLLPEHDSPQKESHENNNLENQNVEGRASQNNIRVEDAI